jgi:4-amino-4-deoxy-L-arabinose transferase-like glycosyltransferase
LAAVSFHALSGLYKRISSPESWRIWAAIVALIIVALHLQGIFASGLWDPWETHYGEVARNIIARDDPMDLWWRPGYGPEGKKEQSFSSKHALPFWSMAVSLKAFGLGWHRAADEMVQPYWPELALRLPSLLGYWCLIAFLSHVTLRLANRRAALLVAIALATMPQLALVGRQAITDMYFVGPVGLAMGAWAMAWLAPDRELKRVSESRWKAPRDRVWWVFIGAFVLFGLVPLVVLQEHVFATRTIERVSRWSKRPTIPNVHDLRNVGLQLMLYWGLAAIVLVRAMRWTRRSQVWMGVVYLAGGLALMGKGLIGPGLIGLLILMHLVVTGRWERLLRCELPVGVVIFVITCFPWHHAMALFRGQHWVQELLIDNNLTRFVAGEQEQAVGSFAFYLRTLGIAALPWSFMLPAIIWTGMRKFIPTLAREATSSAPSQLGGETRRALELWQLALLWFLVSFGLITYSVTKYYHYLTPCLVPLAVLTGLWLDELIARGNSGRPSWAGAALVGVLGLSASYLVVAWVVREPASFAHLTTYLYTGMWKEGAPPTDALWWLLAPFAVGIFVWMVGKTREAAAAMLLSAVMTTGWFFAVYIPGASAEWSQRDMFRVLFANKAEQDPVVGWWFYYRGETFFTKRRIWVLSEPKRDATRTLVDEHRGSGKTLWIVTTSEHAERAPKYFPRDVKEKLETVYSSTHYTLLKLEMDSQ